MDDLFLRGLLTFGSAFGLLFVIIYFGFVKPFKKNTKKSGDTFKDLLERGERRVEAEHKAGITFFGFTGLELWFIYLLFTFWWLYMEFNIFLWFLTWIPILYFGPRRR